MSSLELGVIGNCQISALVDRRGAIVWSCFPRFDGDPVFCSLLSDAEPPETGLFDVELEHLVDSRQEYVTNTPILETVLTDANGGVVKLIDFAPRFEIGRAHV